MDSYTTYSEQCGVEYDDDLVRSIEEITISLSPVFRTSCLIILSGYLSLLFLLVWMKMNT